MSSRYTRHATQNNEALINPNQQLLKDANEVLLVNKCSQRNQEECYVELMGVHVHILRLQAEPTDSPFSPFSADLAQ